MQIAILGPVEVTRAGVAVPVTGGRVRALLARLALGAGRVVSMSELIDAIWPDGPPADAANALQSLISRLRRALGDPGAVVQASGGYRLAIADTDIDAHRFTQAARAGRDALRAGRFDEAAATLAGANNLWRGPALVDLDPPPPAADELAEQYQAARENWLDAEIRRGRGSDVVAAAEALVASYPLRERFTGLLMQALAQSGRSAEALVAYQRHRSFLADELGSDPSAALQAIHLQVLHSGDEPPAEPPAHRTNLRAQRTTFLGRTDEATRIGGLLGSARLVTIVGPGGAGKTRLAAEVAGGHVAQLDDGVWLAELAPVTEPAGIAQAVLGSLGLRANRFIDRGTDREVLPTEDRLVDLLAGAECLLVIDNCEHLIGGVADLVDRLLASCPGVRVLATSREPIGIDGEAICQLGPLPLPPPETAAAEVLAWPAVALFADRAAAVSADFAITDETVTDVVEIVRRLDGLPLAIELAAARLRVMPVREIATRLTDRFRLLTGGSRTAMPRHRTLRAVVEWSWELLTPAERRLAEELAIFPSGADAESATAVAGPDLPTGEIPDLLNALVDKSLLEIAAGDELRYRMLETIREYGTEQLAERGGAEIAAVRERHARYFADLVERADRWLRRAEQVPWVRRLSVEHDNIVAALRYLGDSGDAGATVDLAVRLGLHWTLADSHSGAADWLEFALAVADPDGTVPPARRALTQALALLNALALNLGESEAAEMDRGIVDMRRTVAALDEIEGAFEAEPMLAMVAPFLSFFANDFEATLALVDHSLRLDDPWIRGTLYMFRANLHENAGNVAQMRADTERALELFTAIGDRWGLASTLSSAGMLATIDGDLEAAIETYREASRCLCELGSSSDEAFVRLRIADLCLRRGDVEGAQHETDLVRTSPIQAGTRTQRLMVDSMQANIARRTGDVAAMKQLRHSMAAQLAGFTSFHPLNGHIQSMSQAVVAALELDLGETSAARERLQTGLAVAVGTQDMPIIASTLAVVAGWAAQADRPHAAAEILGAVEAVRGAPDPTEPDFVALYGRLRDALGPRLEPRYAIGQAMDRPSAIARAQQELDEANTVD